MTKKDSYAIYTRYYNKAGELIGETFNAYGERKVSYTRGEYILWSTRKSWIDREGNGKWAPWFTEYHRSHGRASVYVECSWGGRNGYPTYMSKRYYSRLRPCGAPVIDGF